MAALMTSVIENPPKVAEYIYSCRQMGIRILPPDINKGEADFSVDGENIRYGLAAIKSIGRPVVQAVIEERNTFGPFKNLRTSSPGCHQKMLSIKERSRTLSKPASS